jgi:FkbM family methyltransferase
LKNRAGRLAGWGFSRLGANPLVVVQSDAGAFVLDARSRTETEMLWSGHYDDDDVAFLCAATPEDGVFVDIGANVGLVFVPVWRSLVSGQAIAIEPIPVNYDRLAAACAENRGVSTEPTLLNIAVGSEPGVLVLVKEGPAASSDNAVVALDGEQGIEVPVETLDRTCDSLGLTRLDTVKIDVEGFEWEVFTGATQSLARFRPIVYGEFNNQLMPRRGKTFHDVWGQFEPLGYRCFSFLDRLVLDEKHHPSEDLGNAVLVPSEKVDWLLSRGVVIRSGSRPLSA